MWSFADDESWEGCFDVSASFIFCVLAGMAVQVVDKFVGRSWGVVVVP